MLISKSKFVAILIFLVYLVIFAYFNFVNTLELSPVDYFGSYPGSSTGIIFSNGKFVVIFGLILILISPAKTDFSVDGVYFKKESIWFMIKMFGWLCLIFFAPIALIITYIK